MTMEEYKEFLMKNDVESFNKWRIQHPQVKIDLRGFDLSGRKLNGAFFMNTALKSADLSGGTFKGALFCQADLSCADLSNADLSGAQFGPPEFVSPEFSLTELGKSLSFGARMIKVNLQGANIDQTNFREVDLSQADFSNCRNSSTAIFRNTRLDGTVRPKPWYTTYLESLDASALEVRMAQLLKGKVFSEEDLEYLQAYTVNVKLMQDKDLKQEKEEIISLVQHLVNANLSAQDRFQKIFRIHCLIVSSEGEQNIQQLVGCNGHAVLGLMTFDSLSNVRIAANSVLTVLPPHHSTAGRSFALQTIAESGLIKIQFPANK